MPTWRAKGFARRADSTAMEPFVIVVARCRVCGAVDRLGDAAEIVHATTQCKGRRDPSLIQDVPLVPVGEVTRHESAATALIAV